MRSSSYGGYDVLTVAELIALLQKMPQDAEVWHEGDESNGAANGVHLDGDDVVIITRSNR